MSQHTKIHIYVIIIYDVTLLLSVELFLSRRDQINALSIVLHLLSHRKQSIILLCIIFQYDLPNHPDALLLAIKSAQQLTYVNSKLVSFHCKLRPINAEYRAKFRIVLSGFVLALLLKVQSVNNNKIRLISNKM